MMSCQLFSQSSDTTFFPQFVPHTQNPIIDWNDFIVGSWADPTVLKVNNEYIMYASAMHGDKKDSPTEYINAISKLLPYSIGKVKASDRVYN